MHENRKGTTRRSFLKDSTTSAAAVSPRSTSWTTGARFGVCWSGPASPIRVHGAGSQSTSALVVGRALMSPFACVKAGGSGPSSARMDREAASEEI